MWELDREEKREGKGFEFLCEREKRNFIQRALRTLPLEIPKEVMRGGIGSDGMYGLNLVESEVDYWSIFWKLVQAAGKAAEVEWILHQAGRPQTTGGTPFDTRETPPMPGFHLRLTKGAWSEEDEYTLESKYYTYWKGKGFPATEKGLRRALVEAEMAKEKEDVLEVLLEISWRHYLPGDVEEYCAPILYWKDENGWDW